VAFYVVYIREAHPSNVWQMSSNIRDNVIFVDPKTLEERTAIAESCVRKLGIKIPAVVDDLGDGVEAAYTGWPDRLYLIGRDGTVKFKSAPGPFGFHPAVLEEAIAANVH
jgi:hypothetical protein